MIWIIFPSLALLLSRVASQLSKWTQLHLPSLHSDRMFSLPWLASYNLQ